MPELQPAPTDPPPAEEAPAPGEEAAAAADAPATVADATPPAPPAEDTEATVTIGDGEVDVVIDQEIDLPIGPDIEIIVGTDGESDLIVIVIVDADVPDDTQEALNDVQTVFPNVLPGDGDAEITINGEVVDVIGTGTIPAGDIELEVTIGIVDDNPVVIVEGPSVTEIAEELVDAAIEELQDLINDSIIGDIIEAIEDISPIDLTPVKPDAS
jgi:hypothetical protein